MFILSGSRRLVAQGFSLRHSSTLIIRTTTRSTQLATTTCGSGGTLSAQAAAAQRNFASSNLFSSRHGRTMMLLGATSFGILTTTTNNNATAAARCNPLEETAECNNVDVDDANVADPVTLFPAEWIEEDHYSGVTVHLTRCSSENEDSSYSLDTFTRQLQGSLQEWMQQGRKGIWLHIPPWHADKIAAAVKAGFQFHMVNQMADEEDHTLIMNLWLPAISPLVMNDSERKSRLPVGPTHQVGVGCLVFHPHDPSRMLVVQEKTGPAATFRLWKMPTGLADPAEDVHQAAVRELREETGMEAVRVEGILQFRQAHATNMTKTRNKDSRVVYRSISDLFFVCCLAVKDNVTDDDYFKACPDEIAAIQWMPVQDYCQQERWQQSPVYLEMNRIILEESRRRSSRTKENSGNHNHNQQDSVMMQPYTLALGFGRGTNALYHAMPSPSPSQTRASSSPSQQSQL